MYLFHLKVEATGEVPVPIRDRRETVVLVASVFCTPPYSSASR